MTQLTYGQPVAGNPFSTEAPKVDTALAQIQIVVNSELGADNMGDLYTSVTQPTRATGTAYQPSTAGPVIVVVKASGGPLQANIGATSTPTTSVAQAAGSSSMSFPVPKGWYYEIVSLGGTISGTTEFS
jgi:hypothetical protein